MAKVQTAKRAAERKVIRCDDRMTVLEEELEKVREQEIGLLKRLSIYLINGEQSH